MYISNDVESLAMQKKCISCQGTWTIYFLNKKDEIVVVVKKDSCPWAVIYNIQEEWKIKATSFKIEHGWNGDGLTKRPT